jgi:hypothetical protein
MHGDCIEIVEHAAALHVAHEGRINRRDAAEHDWQCGPRTADRFAGSNGQVREHRPIRIDQEIPMRLVVRLVPDLGSLDHGLVLRQG